MLEVMVQIWFLTVYSTHNIGYIDDKQRDNNLIWDSEDIK